MVGTTRNLRVVKWRRSVGFQRVVVAHGVDLLSALALACLVGLVDAATSAYIAFSIFYLIPIFLASWFANRIAAIAIAVAVRLRGPVG